MRKKRPWPLNLLLLDKPETARKRGKSRWIYLQTCMKKSWELNLCWEKSFNKLDSKWKWVNCHCESNAHTKHVSSPADRHSSVFFQLPSQATLPEAAGTSCNLRHLNCLFIQNQPCAQKTQGFFSWLRLRSSQSSTGFLPCCSTDLSWSVGHSKSSFTVRPG